MYYMYTYIWQFHIRYYAYIYILYTHICVNIHTYMHTHMPALAHRVSRPRGTGSVGAGHRVSRRGCRRGRAVSPSLSVFVCVWFVTHTNTHKRKNKDKNARTHTRTHTRTRYRNGLLLEHALVLDFTPLLHCHGRRIKVPEDW